MAGLSCSSLIDLSSSRHFKPPSYSVLPCFFLHHLSVLRSLYQPSVFTNCSACYFFFFLFCVPSLSASKNSIFLIPASGSSAVQPLLRGPAPNLRQGDVWVGSFDVTLSFTSLQPSAPRPFFLSGTLSLSLSQCLPRSSLSPINHHFTHFIPRLLVSFTCPTLTASLTSSFCLFRSTSDHSVVRNPGSHLLNYNTFININAVHAEQNPCIFVIFNRTVQLLRLSTDSPLFVTNFASGFDQNKHQRSSISVNDRSTLKHFICQSFSFLSFLTQMILLVRRDRVVQCDFRLFHEICQIKLIQTH